MPPLLQGQAIPCETCDRLARRTLFGFVITFVLSRVFVFLIMAHKIPNMFFFLNGTHVHHLNYGIFLLTLVCGYSLFRRPDGREAEFTALMYGVSLGLTFDEFGMWLHLGGSYWQRASVDATIVIGAVIAIVAFAPSLRRFETRHCWAFLLLIVTLSAFGYAVYAAGGRLGDMVGPTLRDLESASSP
jgi:hypothetical protein